jgi:hypothetical protein
MVRIRFPPAASHQRTSRQSHREGRGGPATRRGRRPRTMVRNMPGNRADKRCSDAANEKTAPKACRRGPRGRIPRRRCTFSRTVSLCPRSWTLFCHTVPWNCNADDNV